MGSSRAEVATKSRMAWAEARLLEEAQLLRALTWLRTQREKVSDTYLQPKTILS